MRMPLGGGSPWGGDPWGASPVGAPGQIAPGWQPQHRAVESSIPFHSRPKARKPFLYANTGCVGFPGVFITPGTYFIILKVINPYVGNRFKSIMCGAHICNIKKKRAK